MEKSKDWGIVLLFSLYLAYSIMPIASLYMGSVVRTILFLLCLCVIVAQKNVFNMIIVVFGICVIPIFDALFSHEAGGGLSIASKFYVTGNILMPPLIYLYVDAKGDKQFARNLLIMVAAEWIITLITTYVGNIIIPQATRNLAAVFDNTTFYNQTRSLNIAGFDFVYSIPILIPLIVYLVHDSNKKFWPIVLLSSLVMMSLKAEYTTAFLFTLFALFILFAKDMRSVRKYISFLFFLLLIALIFRNSLSSIFVYLANSVQSEVMSVRMMDFADTLNGADVSAQSDIVARTDRYQMAIDMFLDNILLGGGKKGGGHSFILDVLACYGLVGVVLLFIMGRTIYIHLLKQYKEQDYYPYLIFSYSLYIGLLLLNPQPYILTVAFIIPLFCYVEST